MTMINKLIFSAGVLTLITACNPKPVAEPVKELDLSTEQAQLGYTIGSQMASQLDNSDLFGDIDLEALIAAFRDTAEGKEARLTSEQMQQAQLNFQQKAQAKIDELANTNKAKGDAYLVKNAAKEGIVTTESGLQYEVLREGKGDQPAAESSVKVHYVGTLTDGTEFDSSYQRGTPTEFPVGGVIPGFSEGLQLMKAGAKYRFVIPSDQAYGVQGPPSIGPNQALIFEVELIEVL